MCVLILFAPVVSAQNQTNETNKTISTGLNITEIERHYLTIKIEAWVTNVTYWCKGEGKTTYDLFGGVAECQHIEVEKECRCKVSLPDDVLPEYFLSYQQIEGRYEDQLDVTKEEIGSLWWWIWFVSAIAVVLSLVTLFIARIYPNLRWRLF
jgi:hypothetical protein